MAEENQAAAWSPPQLPESVVPAEAFPVGEPDKVGMVEHDEEPIEVNVGRETKELELVNTGDRPVQVGAHYHLVEVNRAMAFDRESAFGFRLDIPSGSAVRFEPGQSRKCRLVRFGGYESSRGMNDITDGSMRSDLTKRKAMRRLRDAGFCFEGETFKTETSPDELYGNEKDGANKGRGEE